MTFDWFCGWPSGLTQCEFGSLAFKCTANSSMKRMSAGASGWGVRGLSVNLTVGPTSCLALRSHLTSLKLLQNVKGWKAKTVWSVYSIFLTLCLSPFGLLRQHTTDWAVYKQNKFISHNSGRWKSRIKFCVWWEPVSRLISGHLLAVSSQGSRRRGAVWELSLLSGRSSHSWGLLPQDLITSQRSTS